MYNFHLQSYFTGQNVKYPLKILYFNELKLTVALPTYEMWMKNDFNRCMLYVFCRIMCFLMILPVVQCYLFCTCIGRDPQGLKLGVVNEELKTGISSCSNYPSSGCNFSVPLSCRYLQNLHNKSYKLVSVLYANFTVYHHHYRGVIRKRAVYNIIYR